MYKIEFIYLFDSEEFRCHHIFLCTKNWKSSIYISISNFNKSIQTIIFISLANQKYHFTWLICTWIQYSVLGERIRNTPSARLTFNLNIYAGVPFAIVVQSLSFVVSYRIESFQDWYYGFVLTIDYWVRKTEFRVENEKNMQG